MATRTDFTEEEWKAMQKGVTGAGLLVSASDRDLTDSFGEAGALAKALAAQRDQGGSDLVREVAKMRGAGFGLIATADDVESETLESLRSTMQVLAAKAPDEAAAYRQLVLDVADAVASSKSGIEPDEVAALDKIRQALGA